MAAFGIPMIRRTRSLDYSTSIPEPFCVRSFDPHFRAAQSPTCGVFEGAGQVMWIVLVQGEPHRASELSISLDHEVHMDLFLGMFSIGYADGESAWGILQFLPGLRVLRLLAGAA